jgi:hypothetical protein
MSFRSWFGVWTEAVHRPWFAFGLGFFAVKVLSLVLVVGFDFAGAHVNHVLVRLLVGCGYVGPELACICFYIDAKRNARGRNWLMFWGACALFIPV